MLECNELQQVSIFIIGAFVGFGSGALFVSALGWARGYSKQLLHTRHDDNEPNT